MKTPSYPITTACCAVIASFLVVLALLTPAQAAGTPAALTWSVTHYDFGSVPVGQTPSQTFTLINTGDKSGVITVSTSGSTVFTITADGCTGKALGADESCNVTIQYPPINTNGDESTLAATAQGSSSRMVLYGNTSANLVLNATGEGSPIRGPVVGQYFGLFEGISKERYRELVAAAPFDKCNLLILAFVRTFTFERPSDEGGPIYVAQFANGRESPFQLDPNDTDGDRVKLVVRMARKTNPSIKILISLGWGQNDDDTEKAARTPVEFADSVRTLVQAYHLDGIDIDFESTNVEPAAMLTLAQEIRRSLNKIRRPMIMTITPAQRGGLDNNVLEQFTYVMPQTYDHGGNGFNFADARWLANQLRGSYERIVYGLDSEAGTPQNPETPDNPKKFADRAKKNHAAGIFAWRLDNDSAKDGFPTFVDAIEMWRLMHQRVP
jgi:glycosyl hydrolase family 18 (putative chitinase)/HYDIN/CFA65/VesB family protein